jgi:hypothetical protein
MSAKDKNLPVGKPKITQLPIPVSETPLVIDLPDGQKLVIGKIATGSVIEVATWRGTGRPDSRTSRLMLGMASGAVNSNSPDADTFEAEESAVAPARNWGRIAPVIKLIQKNTGTLSSLFRKVPWSKMWVSIIQVRNLIVESVKNKANIKRTGSKSVDGNKEFPTANRGKLSDTPYSDEIEEWLDSVVAKAKKASERKKLKGSQAVKPTKSIKSNSKSTKGSKR